MVKAKKDNKNPTTQDPNLLDRVVQLESDLKTIGELLESNNAELKKMVDGSDQTLVIERVDAMDLSIANLLKKIEELPAKESATTKQISTGVKDIPTEELFMVCMSEAIQAVVSMNKPTMLRDAASNDNSAFTEAAEQAVTYAARFHEAIVAKLFC